MDVKTALDKLFSLHQFGVKLGLENITNLLSKLDNPQSGFKSIHIAGSNGKGSTASFIASILMEAGYNVGLYTSPHFIKFNERIRINGVIIEDEYISEFMNLLSDYIDKEEPTFFELTTAMAFKYFNENKIDIAVIETGLGGRLDATNTLNPLASVITTISHEHTGILGNDLRKIAIEKAGIIKKDQKIFIGIMPAAPEEELILKSNQVGSPHYLLKDHIKRKNNQVKIEYDELDYTITRTPLMGEHQSTNAVLAALTTSSIFGIKDENIITKGIDRVVQNTGIQGRYEIYNKSPRVIFDAAHNFEGVEAFISEFKKEYSRYNTTNLIFGAMRDKEVVTMLKKLSPFFDNIFVSSINYERAASIDELKELADREGISVMKLEDPTSLIKRFIISEKEDCLVILGSIYLLGKIKEELLNK